MYYINDQAESQNKRAKPTHLYVQMSEKMTLTQIRKRAYAILYYQTQGRNWVATEVEALVRSHNNFEHKTHPIFQIIKAIFFHQLTRFFFSWG